MNQELLEYLKKITPEEEEMIRSRQPLLERYAKEPGSQVVDRDKMIRPRRMIDVMKQPRFIEVTEHTHNYLEMIYVVSGVSRQVIGGDRELVMKEGDLMFLRQGTYHTVAPAGYDDISVRFSILPEFLQYPLSMLTEDTYLRRFILRVVQGNMDAEPYLQFHLQDMPEAQNLLDNLMLSIMRRTRNDRRILQATMGVLFLELANRTYKITVGNPTSYEQQLVLQALGYVESNYQTATLENFCQSVHQPAYYISRLMKKYSPYTFTKYLQRRLLLQAAHLLTETNEPIEQIIVEVGYENSSHFHRLFRNEYHMTPREYRKKYSVQEGETSDPAY